MSFLLVQSYQILVDLVNMNIKGKKFVVVGGAGLIGSHTVDQLIKEDVKEIIIYDNFVRGTNENISQALRDPRVKIFEVGGDICQNDILNEAFKGADGVFTSLHFGFFSAMNFLVQAENFVKLFKGKKCS